MMRHWKFRFALWLMVAPLCVVNGQSRRELEEQRKKTIQEIAEINDLLTETQQNQKASLEKITLLSSQIEQYGKLIEQIGKEIKQADKRINATNREVSRLNSENERLMAEYGQMVFHAYKNRGRYNKLIYMLSAKNFDEAYRRMKYFQQYSSFRKQQVAEINESKKQLSRVLKQLAARKAEKEKLLADQKRETQQLSALKDSQKQEVQRLKSHEKKLRRQVADKQREAERLQKEIDRLIAEEIRKSKGNAKNLYDKLTPAERLVSNNFKDNKGRLPWPTERGVITGFYGIHPHPLYKDIKLNNSGVDITTVAGSSVRSEFEGVVSRVARINGENLTILVRHGNYITVYMNLVDITVKQGDKVAAKQTIGKIYTVNDSKTAVLHFEIWEETNKQNPEQWLSKK